VVFLWHFVGPRLSVSTRRVSPDGSLPRQSTKSIREAVEVLLHEIEVGRGSGSVQNLRFQKELEIVHCLYVDSAQLKDFIEVANPRWGHKLIRLQPLMYPALRMDARCWWIRTPTSCLSHPQIDRRDLCPFGGVCHPLAQRAGSAMICYQAMQLSNFADRPRLLGEAKYISILDVAIGFDQLATEPIDIWTTKSVHGITPSPDTHGTERGTRRKSKLYGSA